MQNLLSNISQGIEELTDCYFFPGRNTNLWEKNRGTLTFPLLFPLPAVLLRSILILPPAGFGGSRSASNLTPGAAHIRDGQRTAGRNKGNRKGKAATTPT